MSIEEIRKRVEQEATERQAIVKKAIVKKAIVKKKEKKPMPTIIEWDRIIEDFRKKNR